MDKYREKVEETNATNKMRSLVSRDIAKGMRDLKPGDAKRRDACRPDLERFLKTYFPFAFSMEWSADQVRITQKMGQCIVSGGLMAMAEPRGNGKTTRCIRAAIWALLYRHRRFVSLIGATEDHAEKMLKQIRFELERNDLLLADFPWVCYPIRRLESNGRKAIGQVFEMAQTRIDWGAKQLTLPTIPDAFEDGTQVVFGENVSGSTVSVSGITGALRGQSQMLATGEIIRPEFILLDDPQDSESANSPSQCAARLAIINGDVLGMAGPGRKVAAFCPCTVIRPGDLADTLLKTPEWQGERCKMLYSLPTNEGLWEAYAKLRKAGMQPGGDRKAATVFYVKHRKAMDEGAVASWPARFEEGDISAIQHAMNKKIDNEEVFAAEYQNEPIAPELSDSPRLVAEVITQKLNRVPRGIIPADAEYLTTFIDVHDQILYWAACAWSSGFDGWIVDYGSWPDQHRRYWLKRKPAKSLSMQYPGAGIEGGIHAGLTELTSRLCDREWEREDGAVMRVSRGLIDAGWKWDVVVNFCRRSAHAAILMPSKGVGIGAAGKAMVDYNRKQGDRIGFNWYIPKPNDRSSSRHFRFDSNFWKSFIAHRLGSVAIGDKGCLSLYGAVPEEHRMLADHCVAELAVKVTAPSQGRTVDEWRLKPDKPDNDLFDCIVGCAAAASLCGATVPGVEAATTERRRKRYTQADLRRAS